MKIKRKLSSLFVPEQPGQKKAADLKVLGSGFMQQIGGQTSAHQVSILDLIVSGMSGTWNCAGFVFKNPGGIRHFRPHRATGTPGPSKLSPQRTPTGVSALRPRKLHRSLRTISTIAVPRTQISR
jgi:hypothetical protein